MANTAEPAERPGWLQDLNSMLLSALCHLAVLIVLGLLTAASQEEWGGLKLLAQVGQAEWDTLDETPLQATIELEAEPEEAVAIGPVQLFDEIAVATSDAAALTAPSESSFLASGLEGTALAGRAEDDSTALRGSAEFFGIGGYGQSFVYVVDCSGSMNEGGKFERARYELLRSIEQLSSDQRYFIIFFNHAARPMDEKEMVAATQEQFGRTAKWVNYMEAEGGTYPLPALLHALSLRPDAIYFLSDGQFDPMTINVLRQQNRPSRRLGRRQIPIHTIAFIDRSTEALMRTIARNSSGEYRFVR